MPFTLTREYINTLQEVIEKEDEKSAIEMMDELHPADIAEIYDELNMEQAKYLYLLLDDDKAADVIVELEDDDRERFLKALPSEVIAKRFIENMDSDDAADVIAELPELRKEEVLSHLDEVEHAGDIVDLLHYDEDSAGGLMAKELIKVNLNWSLVKCLKEMAKQAEDVDEIYHIYVVDDEDILKGVLSLKKLLIAQPSETIASIYNPDIIYVKTHESSEAVAAIMEKYDLVAVPVIDSIGRLVGRITIDDVVDVIREEAEKDYQMVSGLTEDVEPSDTVFLLTRARLPWLLIGLVGGILGAQVMGTYEHDLAQNAAMAFFIPLIAAMGGNVGVQSSAIVVQGLASQAISLDSTFKKIMKEFLVALLNGTICGSLIFIYNLFFSTSFALTVTVSTALLLVIMFASIFGTFVPLALNRLKIDPAIATGPFITTVNDILGLFIYLAIGRIMFAIF